MIDVSKKKRIVLKLGTSTLTHKTGKLNIRRMTNLVRILSDLHNEGRELLLVSSGAVGMGVGKLNLSERPKDTPSKQAAAAVGQCELMHIYDDMFAKYNVTVAQILLTRATLTNERLPHVQNTIGRLLEMGVIPIVNENDTVAIDELELEIGENDSLSATVAAAVGADLLVILSDINGLYSADPRTNADAQVIREVHKRAYRADGRRRRFGTGQRRHGDQDQRRKNCHRGWRGHGHHERQRPGTAVCAV